MRGSLEHLWPRPGRCCPSFDCMSLLRMLEVGRKSGTAHHRPQARIRRPIFNALGAEDGSGDAGERKRWMPGLGARVAAHSRVCSDGKRMTPLDWRANRLADALAERVARRFRISSGEVRCLQAAGGLVSHLLALFGMVTYEANHQRREIHDCWTTRRVVVRDSQPPPTDRVGEATGTRPRAPETASSKSPRVHPCTLR